MTTTKEKTEKNIYSELLEVQKKVNWIVLKDSDNPYFKSKYASLTNVMQAVRPLLLEHDILMLQFTHNELDKVGVETRLYHVPSQTEIKNLLLLPAVKQDAQALGSAITYARRYSIAPLLGLVADEDDDGNAASHGDKAVQTAQKIIDKNYKIKEEKKFDKFKPISVAEDEIPNFDKTGDEIVNKVKEVFGDSQEIVIKFKYDISKIDASKEAGVLSYISKEQKKSGAYIDVDKHGIVLSEIELPRLEAYKI